MFNPYNLISVASRRGVGLAVIALTLIGVFLSGCNYRGPRATAPNRNITAQEVAEQTKQLIGQKVTVRSEVVRQVSPSAFTISDEQFLGSGEILVVNATGEPFTFPPQGIEIQTTGEVRQFDIGSVTQEFDLELQPEAYEGYENQPVIIAQSLAVAPKPGEITKNPHLFYYRTVAVEAEIEKVLDPMAFTLKEEQVIGGRNLLVFNPTPVQAIRPEQNVVVTGVIRPFVVSELDRDYKLTRNFNIQKTVEAEYRNKPVLIAQEVFPLPR
jgi:hypothetical protein